MGVVKGKYKDYAKLYTRRYSRIGGIIMPYWNYESSNDTVRQIS